MDSWVLVFIFVFSLFIRNNVAMNILIRVFWYIYFALQLGNEFVDQWLCIFSALVDTT